MKFNLTKFGDILQWLVPVTGLGVAIPFHDKTTTLLYVYQYVISNAICQLIKGTTFAQRPNAKLGFEITWKWSWGEADSFPSGHTTSAMAGAFGVMMFNLPAGLALFVFAAICGYSRIAAMAHWPRDVYFGATLAAAIAGMVQWDIMGITQWILNAV